jgi:hypothetical protein
MLAERNRADAPPVRDWSKHQETSRMRSADHGRVELGHLCRFFEQFCGGI